MSCACVSVHEDMFMFVQSRSQFIFQLTCTKLVSTPDPPPFFVGGKSGSETSRKLSGLENSLGSRLAEDLRLAENSLGLRLAENSLGLRLAENSLGLRLAENSLGLLAENSLGSRLPENSLGMRLPENSLGMRL